MLRQVSAVAPERNQVSRLVEDVVRGTGRALEAGDRAALSARFGHDFGQVRIHADDQAAESAHLLGAAAYTLGNHVVFGAGGYAPREPAGQRRLAHEMVHVMQQTHAPANTPADGARSQAAERQADDLATTMPVPPHAGSPLWSMPRQIQRQPESQTAPAAPRPGAATAS